MTNPTMKKKTSTEPNAKVEQLRALRLAHEQSRKAAGEWGEVSVGEIVHEASRSVFVETWKGPQRPDPFRPGSARGRGATLRDWTVLTAWISAQRIPEFARLVVARDVTEAAARELVQARIAARRAEGYAVMNPPDTAA